MDQEYGLGVDKKAYNLIEWSQVCKSNEKGGLGIINMENMNKALLTRWWWNLLTQPDKTINKIFKDRYGPRRGTQTETYRNATNLSFIRKGINSTIEILQAALAYELGDVAGKIVGKCKAILEGNIDW